VDDAEAALSGNGDGHVAFRYGVHRRGDKGYVQVMLLRYLRAHISRAWFNFSAAWKYDRVSKGKSDLYVVEFLPK